METKTTCKKRPTSLPEGVLASEQQPDVQTSEVTNRENASCEYGSSGALPAPPNDSCQKDEQNGTTNIIILVDSTANADSKNWLTTFINSIKGDKNVVSTTDKNQSNETPDKVEPANNERHQSLRDPNLLTIEEASEFLPNHPTKSTLRTMCNRGKIPYCKMGGRLIFKKNELKKYIERSLSHGYNQY